MRLRRSFTSGFIGFILAVSAFAADGDNSQSPTRARFAIPPSTYRNEPLTISPLILSGGSSLTLIAPQKWDPIGNILLETVEKAHVELSARFGEVRPFLTSVRLLDRNTFLRQTGAPSWTNALFYKGEILIPLSENDALDVNDLVRATRHEFSHAVLHALSAGRCPGWLDEGLAQHFEGPASPILTSALDQWLSSNNPVSFRLLQGGFTKLPQDMVAAAYAQSLYAAQLLLNTQSSARIRTYLDSLRTGEERAMAFYRGFGITEQQFEQTLFTSLKSWAKSTPKGTLKLSN